MISNNSRFFVEISMKCDYIPIVSTLNNLTALFLKHAILPFINQEVISSSHYYTHLQEKSNLRCVTLLIPVLGNWIIYLDDLNRKNDRDIILFNLDQGITPIRTINRRKDDREFMLSLIQTRPETFHYASDRLKNDELFKTLYEKTSGDQVKEILGMTLSDLGVDTARAIPFIRTF